MAISDEITRLQQAKAALKTSIEGKGVTVSSDATLDDYADLVDSIEAGGGVSLSSSDVNFIDYDGTIVASYTASEFASLSSMPANPDHTSEGLVAQGWNWTLADAKTYVETYGTLNIGQMYVTDNGATRITIDTHGWTEQHPIKLQFSQSSDNCVAVDFGDGSEVERKSGTSNVIFEHIYETDCVFTISIMPDVGTTATIGYTSSNYLIIGATNSERLGVSSIISVSVGERVSLGDYAFRTCYFLQFITIPNTVTSFGISNFYSCESLRSLTIPSGVTSIGNGAFNTCTGLRSVSIPNSLTSIGIQLFSACYSLRSITIPNSITSINNYFVSSCHSLRSITIPYSVTSIGNQAFNGTSLRSITIPNSVTNIGTYVFSACSSLLEIIIANTTPPTIGTNAFGQSTDNAIIYVPDESVDTYKSRYTTYASRIKGISER